MRVKSDKTALLDSSSAILLFNSGICETVLDYYRAVISLSVFDELTHEGYPGAKEFWEYRDQDRLRVIDLKFNFKSTLETNASLIELGAGERDTICLYLNGYGHLVVIDDGKGALTCKKMNIPYINALLVPRILLISSVINIKECDDTMDLIIHNGRYTPGIIEFARTCDDGRLMNFV